MKLSENVYWSNCTTCERDCTDGCDKTACKNDCLSDNGYKACWGTCIHVGCQTESCQGGCG